MKIFHKVIIGFLSISLVMGCLGYLSVSMLSDLKYHVDQLSKSSVIEFESANHMQTVLDNSHLAALKLDVLKNDPTAARLDKKAVEELVKEIQLRLREFSGLINKVTDATKTAVNMAQDHDDEDIELGEVEELEKLLYPLRDIFTDYKASMDLFVKSVQEGGQLSHQQFASEDGSRMYSQMRSLVNEIREDARGEMHEDIAEIIGDYIPEATQMVIGLTALCFVLSIGLGFVIARTISNPIKELAEASKVIGQGRLDRPVRVNTTNEVGMLAKAFDQMRQDLNRTLISKDYLDNIFESMLDALIILSPDLNIRTVNEAACTLGGYSKEELIGRPVQTVLGPEPECSSIFDQVQLKSAGKNAELIFTNAQKQAVPVLFSARALIKDDQLDSIVCAARDISERKAAELALQNAHDQMEQKVVFRTRELANTAERLKKELNKNQETSEALARSEDQLRRLSYNVLMAQEDERQRLSRELHDELGQSLSFLKMRIGAIRRELPLEHQSLDADLQELRQLLNLVIDEVRRLSQDLSPSLLADLGLSAALRKIGKEFANYHAAEVSFDLDPIDDLMPSSTQIMLYRIFQEAFTNIAKHAQASEVQVSIRQAEQNIEMVIRDNGKGFDPDQVNNVKHPDQGLGLTSILERARMLNAQFDLWSKKGQGTRLSLSIPIAAGS